MIVSLARSVTTLDWAELEIPTGLRGMLGIAIPLGLGLALNRPAAGVFGAIGALSVGFGAFQGVYRTRAAAMLVASLGISLSLLLGTIGSSSLLAETMLVGVAAFIAGLLVALGPAAAFVGLQCAITVVFASGYPATLGEAAGRAFLVLDGGLLQTLLAVSVWPLRRFPEERRKLSAIYRALADYAGTIPSTDSRPPEPRTLAEAGFIRDDPQPLARRSQMLAFQALLDQAERIRTSLAALVSDRPGGSDGTYSADLAADARLAAAAAAALGAIATAVGGARNPDPLPALWDQLAALPEPAPAADRQELRDALMGQLRAAYRLAMMPSAPPDAYVPIAPTVARARAIPPLGNALQVLRANLNLRSAVFRHAARLSVTVAIATLLYHLVALGRGYWLSIAVLLVLRPGYRDTFTRGLAWLGGLLLGAGLATAITVLLHPNPVLLAVLVVVLGGAAYAVFRVSYAAFTICITGYVVFLVALAGVPESTAITYRLLDGALGGALALAAYAIWPTWEAREIPTQLALLLEALNQYGTTVLLAYTSPASYDASLLSRTRAAARLARSNAESSLDRMLAEPAGHRALDPARAMSIVAAIRRYALAALALHAHLEQGQVSALTEVVPLARQLEFSLAAVARALATGTQPPSLPDLRATHLALARSLGRSMDQHAALVLAETDLMVDGVKTVAERITAAKVSAAGSLA